MLRDLVNAHFEAALTQLGYGDLTDRIEWSLRWCQGDGMAMYGRISDAERLIDRFTEDEGERAALKRAFDEGASLEVRRNGYGHHYSHYNTMELHWDEGGAFDIDENATSGHERLENEAAIDAFERFHNWVAEDLRETSMRLEREGYAIVEACLPGFWCKGSCGSIFLSHPDYGQVQAEVLREVRRGRLMVRWIARDLVGNGDDELEEIAARMISGELVGLELQCLLYEIEDDDEMQIAASSPLALVIEKDWRKDHDLKAAMNELFREAAGEIRAQPAAA